MSGINFWVRPPGSESFCMGHGCMIMLVFLLIFLCLCLSVLSDVFPNVLVSADQSEIF